MLLRRFSITRRLLPMKARPDQGLCRREKESRVAYTLASPPIRAIPQIGCNHCVPCGRYRANRAKRDERPSLRDTTKVHLGTPSCHFVVLAKAETDTAWRRGYDDQQFAASHVACYLRKLNQGKTIIYETAPS